MLLLRLFIFLLLTLPASFGSKPKGHILSAVKPVIHSIEDDDFIPWSMERKLTWDDFLCEPQHNLDAVALTSTALGISYRISSGVFSYHINCDFSKTKSWGLLKTPYILAHEQGHFDITEIFARKLHQALQQYELKRSTFRDDINDIYDNIIKEKEAFQETYDHETSHSRNKLIQKVWLERIEELLAETESFAKYP